MASNQKSRKPKQSKGINGGGGKMPHLTAIQKVLLGKGQYPGIAKRLQGK